MKKLYINGVVVTMDQNMPQASALVVEGNRILSLGSEAEMKSLAGDAEIIDMQGGALFPGFNETHTHLSMYALYSSYAYLGACETIDEVLHLMKEQAQKTTGPVIVGYSFDDTRMSDGRKITRHELDQVSIEKSVFIIHISAHLGFLNTFGLAHFDIDASTPDPEGGTIHREADGFPEGRVDELAFFAIPAQLGKPTATEYRAFLETAMAEYNSKGITAIHDAGLGLEGMPETVMAVYDQLIDENKLNLRIFLSALPPEFETLNSPPYLPMEDKFFIIGGVKLFIDGSIQGETAALLEPYSSKEGWRGELFSSAEDFEALVEKYYAAGHHLSIHGNGDAAIETIIVAIEKAQAKGIVNAHPHMLIHCQMASRNQLKRMRAIGLIPSFFGMHVENWGDRHHDIFLGSKRADRIDPAGDAEAMGLPFTLHTDTPVLPIQVIESIHVAVNRRSRGGRILGDDQRVTAYSAVAAYTSVASICSGSDKHRGSLTAGKLADMVLLSQDITTCASENIRKTTICATIVDGNIVYRA